MPDAHAAARRAADMRDMQRARHEDFPPRYAPFAEFATPLLLFLMILIIYDDAYDAYYLLIFSIC